MFIGHFGLGFGAKRIAPVSLGVLFAACQWADLLWPTLVLVGVERVEVDPGNTAVTPLNFVAYPYSHSLEALGLWAVAAAVVYWFIRRSSLSASFVIGGLVLSHWVLDWITHRRDMPLTVSGSERVGLSLWNSVPGTVIVETVIFAAGVIVYLRATRSLDRVGSIGCWTLIGFLALVYAANLAGPPPPSASIVAWSAQAMWLLVAWAYWIDKHRETTAS
jgi:membrane-bound metal-dependent hydrolase YbcI (DUF457 family)